MEKSKIVQMSWQALLTVFIIIQLPSCNAQNAKNQGRAVKDLNAEEFESGITEEVILLDVRTPKETNQGTIPGAATMDFYAADFEQQIAGLDTSKAVYVYCRSGGRSAKAAKTLLNAGFDEVYNLEGGIMGWQQAGKPIN